MTTMTLQHVGSVMSHGRLKIPFPLSCRRGCSALVHHMALEANHVPATLLLSNHTISRCHNQRCNDAISLYTASLFFCNRSQREQGICCTMDAWFGSSRRSHPDEMFRPYAGNSVFRTRGSTTTILLPLDRQHVFGSGVGLGNQERLGWAIGWSDRF